MTQDEAYDEIVRLGRKNALIYQASGGMVLILHPDTQKSEGLYEEIQRTHGIEALEKRP